MSRVACSREELLAARGSRHPGSIALHARGQEGIRESSSSSRVLVVPCAKVGIGALGRVLPAGNMCARIEAANFQSDFTPSAVANVFAACLYKTIRS